MDIGVLGGTFDPVHNGHLAIAGEAISRLGLERVIFIPAGQPWLKGRSPIASAAHRVEMVKLAIRNSPRFMLSMMEIDHPGPSYTIDTMILLREQFGPETCLYFLMGWDAFASITLWKEPSKLVRLCKLVVLTRLRGTVPDIRDLERDVPGITRSTIFLNISPIHISSSDIRQRVAKGLSINGLVPSDVKRYIQQHRLYQ